MKKILSFILIFLTVCWTAFVFCLLYPIGKEYLNKNNKKYIAAKIKEINTIGEQIKLLKIKQQNTAAKIFPPEDVLIKASHIKNILIKIKDKTDQLNIKTMKVEFGKINKTSESTLDVAEQQITVTINAPYNKIARYINILKASPLLTEIKEISVAKADSAEALKTKITFNVLCTS